MNLGQVRDKESPDAPVRSQKRLFHLAIAKLNGFGGFLRPWNFFARGLGLQPIPLVILRVLHVGRLGG